MGTISALFMMPIFDIGMLGNIDLALKLRDIKMVFDVSMISEIFEEIFAALLIAAVLTQKHFHMIVPVFSLK